MQPVRVCFPFMGRELGGSHISALGLIRGLDRTRYMPVLVFQHLDGPVFEYFQSETAEIAASPPIAEFEPGQSFGPAAIVRALSGARGLGNFLRDLAVEIVHCNDGRSNAVWSIPAKLAGLKLIWHNRGNPEARGLRFAAPLIADRVISVSAFASPRPGMLSAASKNDVVYSPFDVKIAVDRKAARATIVAELRCAPATRLVGYFGLLIDRKRPLLFVETIALMQRAAPETPVMGLLFGDANTELAGAALALAKEYGVADNIRMMGFRSPGAVWIGACDLLLVTAVEEPFGRTLIEAMIVGTPVVATASGGNLEAIIDGQTGLLAPADDAPALAAAAARVLDDPALRARLTIAASSDARSKFGESRHVEAIMRIYDETLAGRRSMRDGIGAGVGAPNGGVAS